MATTDRRSDDTPTADLASAFRDGGLITVVTSATGPGVAAAGALGDLAAATETPFQVCLAKTREAAVERVTASDDRATVVAIGFDLSEAALVIDAAVPTAPIVEAASAMDGRIDPALVAAGAVAAGRAPSFIADATAALDAQDYGRTAGIVSPGEDRVDSLAHSTVIHGPFSGSTDRASSLLSELPADPSPRAVASAVAVSAARDDDRPNSAGEAIERGLRPFAIDSPWGSIEGLADVLEATARVAPGTAAALALGHAEKERVRAVWRQHGQAVHAAVRSADLARYDGLVEAGASDAPPASVARLLRDFRAPEPAVLILGTESVGLATSTRDASDWLRTATEGDRVGGTDRLATARTADPEDTAAAIREER